MRYYGIQIFTPSGAILIPDPQTGAFVPKTFTAGLFTYTSYVNGISLPGALNIEFDIPIAGHATPNGAYSLRVWGPPLAQLSTAADLTNLKIALHGGMQKGLPLANPQQAGLIAGGIIKQSFGNWIGTDMTLDMVIFPDVGTNEEPKNIVLNWLPGVPLEQALAVTLQTAFPNAKVKFGINSNLVIDYNEVHYVATLTQLAWWIKQRTRPILGGDYPGVEIGMKDDGTITVFDWTVPFGNSTRAKPKQIAFQDMVGQPTWIKPSQIQIKTVMRADIDIHDYIQLPAGIVGSPGVAVPPNLFVANTIPRNNTTFAGTFAVKAIHHFGNFRQASADSWCTTIDAYLLRPVPPVSLLPPSGD